MTAHSVSDLLPVTLYVPLRRNDGQPDNSPLHVAATLNELSFRFTQGNVVENHQDHYGPHAELIGTCPQEKFIPGLLKALARLAVPYIDSDEDAGAVVAQPPRKPSRKSWQRTSEPRIRDFPVVLTLIDGIREPA